MPDGSVANPDAFVPGDATPVDAARSTITVDRVQAVAGVDQVIVTITLHDGFGMPIRGGVVHLMATGTGNMFSLPAPTTSAGLTTATFTSTAAELKTLSATVGGVTIAGPMVTFIPGPAAKLGFGQQPTDVVAGSLFSPTVRVETQDAFGNAVGAGTGNVILTLSANPGVTTVHGASTAALMNGVASFPAIHIDVVGTGYSLRAQAAGFTNGISTAFDVTGGTRDASLSAITAAPTSLEANGVDTTQVTFHVVNTFGAPAGGVSVSVMVSGTGNTLVPTSGVTDNHGDFRATLSSTTTGLRVVTGIAGLAMVTGSVTFYPPSCRPMLPTGPVSVIDAFLDRFHVADIDGDGHRDVVVAWSSQIAVLRNRGDGTFEPEIATTVPTTGPINSIASADFNGDGKLDLAVASSNDSFLTLLMGAGNGQFTVQTFPLPHAAGGLIAADFNLDGKPDLLMSQALTDSLFVELGAGNGTFTASATIDFTSGLDVKVLDANLDGIPDLVYFTTQHVRTALGVGNGAFQASTSVATETSGTLVTGYINNDLVPDVMVVDGSLEKLVPYLGNGAGSFIRTADVPYGTTGSSVVGGSALVDLDGDGNRDLILGAAWTTTIFHGDGAGGFTRVGRYLARTEAVTDVTGDGQVDLVAHTATDITVAPGTSTAAFIAPPELISVADTAADMFGATADFDGNGRKDYALSGTRTASRQINPLLVQSNGGVTFGPTSAATESQPYDVVAGDFTGDGKPDVAMVRGAFSGVDLGIAVGDGTGGLGAFTTQNVTFPYTTDLVAADFNHDGIDDLLLDDTGAANFAIALGTGTSFGAPQITTCPKPGSIAVADISGDGVPDVVVAGTNAFSTEIDVYLATGTGALMSPTTIATATTGVIAIGDFTNDGTPDLVFLPTQPTQTATPTRQVMVYPNQGAGVLGAPLVTTVRIPTLLSASAIHVLDVTADGNADVVISSRFGTSILAGYGDGYVRQGLLHYPFASVIGAFGDPIAINDHDGDGVLDFAYWASGLYVARNAGCTP